jgi:hypothetical protein
LAEAAMGGRSDGGGAPKGARLKAKLGEVMVERDLLREKIAALEAGHPSGR